MVSDFIFDGKLLSDFGYIAIQQDSEETPDVSAMKFDTIQGARTDKAHRVSYNYEQNYTTTFTLIKNSCDLEGDDLGFLNTYEISELTRWLARKQYKWFREIDDNEENEDDIWYEVQNRITKEYVGENVVGLNITVEANTPYGYTREISVVKDDVTEPFELYVSSDEEGYIYPDIVISITTPGTLVINNENEDRATRIKNCTVGETITIYGDDLQQIVSSIADRDFSNDFNYVFPRLCNLYEQGGNVLDVYMTDESGATKTYSVSLTFTYRGIRKVGM
jgi:hypothetical protein